MSNSGSCAAGSGNDRRAASTRARFATHPPTWPRPSWWPASVPDAQLVDDATLPGTDIVLVLGKSFQGLGTTTTTGGPTATTTPVVTRIRLQLRRGRDPERCRGRRRASGTSMAGLLRPLRDLARARERPRRDGRGAVNRGIDTRVAKIKRVHVELAAAPPGGANFLIIGSDTRAFVANSGRRVHVRRSDERRERRGSTFRHAHGGARRARSQRTFVVSFPRDLMVNVPGTPGLSRINTAYSIGGPQLVIDTLKANFDIDIHHYLEVDFKSFQEIVNEIGYVTRVPPRSRPRPGDRAQHAVRRRLLRARRRRRARLRAVAQPRDLRPRTAPSSIRTPASTGGCSTSAPTSIASCASNRSSASSPGWRSRRA